MSYRDEFRRGVDDATWSFWRVFWAFSGILIVLLIFAGLLGLVGWAISVPSGVVRRVVNPDAIVQNYEWYESQYQDIQAADNQIATAEQAAERFKMNAGPRENWKLDERQEMGRLNDILDGLRYYRSRLAADYNAKSRMISRSMWKRSDLPYRVD